MPNRPLPPLIYQLLRRAGRKDQGVASDAALLQRFIDQCDETAFETLVWRHGPLVMGTCRRMLRDGHDAEDAFQATFLVLFRKAGSVRCRRSLGSWLFKVAYRVALRTRSRACGRQEQQQAQLDPPAPASAPDPLGADVRPILDEQLQRLPEKYRAPLVLHYLEGMTVAQVAEELGWPPGTVSVRLDRAKRLLRKRLLARGLALSAAPLAFELGHAMASAPVPAGLVAATVQAAQAYATAPLAGTVPASVGALVEGETRSMFLTKIKVVAALMVTACVAVGVAAGAWQAMTFSAAEPAAHQQVSVQHSNEPPVAAPAPAGPLGDVLPPGVLARMGIPRFRHLRGVTAVAFSPDGKTLASGTGGPGDQTISLWEAETGKEIRALKHPGWIWSVVFSPDGKILASAGGDHTVLLWDTGTGQKLRTLVGHNWQVRSLAFSPDGKTLASASDDTTIRLWEIDTGKEIGVLQRHQGEVLSVAYSPDGKTLASGSEDKTVRLWETATGKELHTLKGHDWRISSVAFSRDSKMVASGSADTTVRLWDAATGKQIRSFKDVQGSAGSVSSVAFSPDGETLASAGLSSPDNIRLWQVATGKVVRAIKWDGVTAITFSPDGKTLAAGTNHWTIGLWDAATGKEVRPPKGHALGIQAVAFSPDGKTLASGSTDMTVRLWEAATGKEIRALEGHTSAICSVAFSPDGKTLASASADMTVRLWDTATGQASRTLRGPKGAIVSVAFSPDGKSLGLGSSDGTVRLLDAASTKEILSLQGQHGTVHAVAFSADGKTLAAGSGNTLRLWQATTGKELRTIKGSEPLPGNFGGFSIVPQISSVAFSPDGMVIAAANHDGKLRLWELATGKEIRSLVGRDCAAFSPDGKTLASGSGMTLHLWDALTGKEIRTFNGHKGGISSVSFSPDGKTLASGSSDTTALVWQMPGHERGLLANPSQETLDSWWSRLASDDVPQAHAAIAALVQSPQASVPFLKERVRPVVPADAERLEQLLAGLKSDQFEVRQKVSHELEQLGDLAEPMLRGVLNGMPSLEVRQRVDALLDKLQNLSGERLRLWRVIRVLEAIGTPETQAVLKTLSAGAPASRLTQDAKASLERLAKRAGAG